VCVSSEGYLTEMLLKEKPKQTNNAIKTTFENMMSNGPSYNTVFSPIA
jgi:hypothetical protein